MVHMTPLTGDWPAGQSMNYGLKLMTDAINANDQLLPNHTLTSGERPEQLLAKMITRDIPERNRFVELISSPPLLTLIIRICVSDEAHFDILITLAT